MAPFSYQTAFALLTLAHVFANPFSKPYIAYRTSPFDQSSFVHHVIDWNEPRLAEFATRRSRLLRPADLTNAQCPLHFTLGLAKRANHHDDRRSHGTVRPPVIYPVFPSQGPGRQVITTTRYEHINVLSPGPAASTTTTKVVKESLWQQAGYPLLLEGSSFATSPLLHDVNGDGRMEAILVDYDGGVFVTGLTTSHHHRYFQTAQVPRLYLRRQWLEHLVNETKQQQQQQPGLASSSSSDIVVVNMTGNHTPHRDYHPPQDPYHSYFEFYYSNEENEALLRGVPANVLEQDYHQVQALHQRRERRVHHQRQKNDQTIEQSKRTGQLFPEEHNADHQVDDAVVDDLLASQREEWNERLGRGPVEELDTTQHEREFVDYDGQGDEPEEEPKEASAGQEEVAAITEEQQRHRRLQEVGTEQEGNENIDQHNTGESARQEQALDTRPKDVSGSESGDTGVFDDNDAVEKDGSNPLLESVLKGDDLAMDDPSYGNRYDDIGRFGGRHRDYDDIYADQNEEHHTYYDSKHYIRIPPHILCTPVLAEIPKLYSNTNEKDDVLFVAVSYFLDEDEYEGFFSYKRFEMTDQGDENEVKRGTFVANAIMAYILGDSPRWTGQTHLDLSTDYSAPENATLVGSLPVHEDLSSMGAFALGSPAVADIDGDGHLDVLMGTSMGMVYAFDARQMYKKSNWPVQMRRPVESRIVVEDVVGDTNLEIFVADIGGNVVCLNHEGTVIWHRHLPSALSSDEQQLLGSSPMTLGDVDGNGSLDVVIALRVDDSAIIFALDAATGHDIPIFPIEVGFHGALGSRDVTHQALPQPLLVDLHADQSFLTDYLRRNGSAWTKQRPKRDSGVPTPNGGAAAGLHIVYPVDGTVYIVEGGSGCTQNVVIGGKISSMVQVDDVHGTNRLDLVISTEDGDTITLESNSPFHPLNTWNHGELRGRTNSHAHGASASQGIYVHPMSRQYIDVFGVYIPITFEIFDNRPNIQNEPNKRHYSVEIRDGPSSKRALFRKVYYQPDVYTERVYIPYGPGYYSLNVVLFTSHGLLYEDVFHVGYNVHFLSGFGLLLWLPLCVTALTILLCGARRSSWDEDSVDEEYSRDDHLGILGRTLPT